MSEFNRRWKVGKMRKHLCIRWWWYRNPVVDAVRWLFGYQPWRTTFASVYLRTSVGNQDVCYCPVGSDTKFRIELFGVGCWGWLSRDWIERPCHCDKIMWLLYPENYECEIEEYGLENLKAEYPDVAPLG